MRFFLSLLFVLALASPARADFAPADPETLQVEAYLNGIHTLKARFIQTSGDGKQVAGDFYLDRPGHMRFQYDPPVTDFIVADGLFVYYYDGQMKQQSNTPITLSLADFFLRKNLSFSGDLKVSGIKRDGGLLQVTLVQTKDPLAGSLTLGFTENPMQLKKWRVVDPQGAVTEVELFDLQTGITLKSNLFKYYDPSHNNPSYN